uniref:Protein TIC 20 n=1 Tax=Phaseolus vulgaris TaxID=3885 RepID=V7APX0_PHAVU|nr:hypothetical protein PHAVU_010G151100g [Phaseolus vulgaris]ESW07697.1 hypothetical protein PHAVU_010G151100g [Phaseolus vulgaris]
MIQNGCIVSQGCAPVNSRSRNHVLPTCSIIRCASRMSANVAASKIRSFSRHNLECKSSFPRGMTFSNVFAAPSLRLSEGQNLLFRSFPALPQLRKSNMVPRASSKDVPTSFRYPPMTKKPQWWWRSLTWMYAETAYNLHPFLECFEFYTYPFLMAIGSLPSWFLMAYFFVAYLGIVRRKEWPHFFRFHVVMGMLLEIALQVIGTVSRWMPLSLYWGKFGMHFWTAVSFGYLFTVLESIRCALVGMYADIPFICDAAYIQIPYD